MTSCVNFVRMRHNVPSTEFMKTPDKMKTMMEKGQMGPIHLAMKTRRTKTLRDQKMQTMKVKRNQTRQSTRTPHMMRKQ